MKTVYITRRETFNAAHKLWNDKWTEEKNFEVFGKCANQNWHGHNFQLFVTVKGVPDEDTGFVMNLKTLGAIIKEKVSAKLDHKNLNLDVPMMEGVLASTENLVVKIWEELENPVVEHGGKLCKLVLWETENNYVEYFGGEEPF